MNTSMTVNNISNNHQCIGDVSLNDILIYKPSNRLSKTQIKSHIKRATKFARQGGYKKALEAIVSRGLSDNNDTNRRKFTNKLLPATNVIIKKQFDDATTFEKFEFSEELLQDAANRLNKLAGVGFDGWQVIYIVQLTQTFDDCPDFGKNFIKFLQDMANGELSMIFANDIKHCRAIMAKKEKKEYKDGIVVVWNEFEDKYNYNDCIIHSDIRPINIQSVIIRLCNKMVFMANPQLSKQLCLQHQIGIGTQGGAQAMIAAGQYALQKIKQDEQLAIMKLDFENAYNRMDMDKFINIIYDKAAELYGLYYQRYGTEYKLFHTDGTFDIMYNGGSQGDSLATSALTAIQLKVEPVIYERCRKLKHDWKLLVSARYHDDGLDMAKIEDLELYQTIAAEEYLEYGMVFKTKKSELILNKNYNINRLPKLFGNFQLMYEQLDVLGIPIGDEQYRIQYVIEKILGAREVHEGIKLIENNKIRCDMTRLLNNISKLHYLVSNMEYIEQPNNKFIKELDKLDNEKIQSIITAILSANQKATRITT